MAIAAVNSHSHAPCGALSKERDNGARNVGGRIELCQKGLALSKAHVGAWALLKLYWLFSYRNSRNRGAFF